MWPFNDAVTEIQQDPLITRGGSNEVLGYNVIDYRVYVIDYRVYVIDYRVCVLFTCRMRIEIDMPIKLWYWTLFFNNTRYFVISSVQCTYMISIETDNQSIFLI